MHVWWNNAVLSIRTRDVLFCGNPCGYVGYWSWRCGHPVHWSSGHLSCCRVATLGTGVGAVGIQCTGAVVISAAAVLPA